MTTISKYLKDYREPNYWVNSIDLTFEILADKVIVKNKSTFQQNISMANNNTLNLNGSASLLELYLDGKPIKNYQLANDELVLSNLAANFTLEIVTEVEAFNNKSCMGLYASKANLFTQCEPEGFRKITYYLDRPDVMAKFTTTIIASTNEYPVLLSNGNKIAEKILGDGRIQVTWQDPFKKPSYLFALVAGKFSKISGTHVTRSGRVINLEVYSDGDSIDQCQHCLDSLKRAMEWDEKRFYLEYDLDTYMIVASSDFNMGAMENKGLNIFNTKYVLADSKTATDTDFVNVEAVVGHEYFHNWTGNRVTCRDWFQLSLKEGLTVFRDQEFTADLHSRAVKRIQDVKMLRQLQFTEDASPLAHPVQPESYIEINNFYTMTVYEKGAEVVRMYQTILGASGFNLGLELYFARHDGYAVTCADFCQAMMDANQFDLKQFMLWYKQAGTPLIKVQDQYNASTQEYNLIIEQIIPDSPQQGNKQAMLIPIAIGLIAENGRELDFKLLEGNVIYPDDKCILLLKSKINKFTFAVNERPTPSLLRGFSAPVIIDYPYTNEQLLNLAANDKDSFNRWEAIQVLYRQAINRLFVAEELHPDLVNLDLINALNKTLNDTNIDPSIKSLVATSPSLSELINNYQPADINRLDQAIYYLKTCLAHALEPAWLDCYQNNITLPYDFKDLKQRSLKNVALHYLLLVNDGQKYNNLAKEQYLNSDNMTDKVASLSAINDNQTPLRKILLAQFEQEYAKYPLVMDKWFTLQSQSRLPATLEEVQLLLEHPLFDKENPNKLYSLIRSFTSNAKHFNTSLGYQFIAHEILRIDKFNPGVASRIAQGFSLINNLNSYYQSLAKPALQRILSEELLSKDVYEIISKTLDQLL